MEISSENYADSLSEDGRYRLLVEAITDYAIYMLDPNGRITNWNAGAQRFKGYTAPQIIGRHFEIFYTDEDRQAGLPAQNLRRAREEGRLEQEGWRIRQDGSRFWAHVIIDRILDAGGNLVGFAKITRDLTERRETQRQLDEARDALFQAQKMEAIGQLTGGVAHDFNNLLMAIMGSLEIVQRRLPASSPVMPFVENALKGARRGSALTKRMLAFARRQELKMTSVDVSMLITGMADMLERALGPSILLNFDLAANAPLANSDPAQLENAILNLAVNARDAMTGGGIIVIGTKVMRAPVPSEDHQGTYLVVSVEDNGEGMDAETLSHAIEPFFTTKEIGQGTGLGLAMVHGMAEQSGGWLHLSSATGKGTRAEIWLPLTKRDAPDAIDELEDLRATKAPRLRVLAVDDDALVLINTVAMLEELGHEVVQAQSADEALELARRGPFDLVVTDQGMPHMTGLQMIEKMRGDGARVPAIIATGYADLPAQGDEITKLEKPFSMNELGAAIEAAACRGPGPSVG